MPEAINESIADGMTFRRRNRIEQRDFKISDELKKMLQQGIAQVYEVDLVGIPNETGVVLMDANMGFIEAEQDRDRLTKQVGFKYHIVEIVKCLKISFINSLIKLNLVKLLL